MKESVGLGIYLFVLKVIWVLRATKAFNHLFPVEKEKDLAKVVAYEKYCLLFFPNKLLSFVK